VRIKTISIVFASICLLIIGLLAYFFICNDAPIIHGKVLYNIEFKENLKLDIYLPTKQVFEKAPVILYFHGGAWIGGGKELINANRFNAAFNTLRESGYVIVCPDYTLAEQNKSPFPDCLIDGFDVIDWVEDHALHYHFDLQNVGVFGESSGGHIALMTAYADADIFSVTSNNEIKINYVVDVYGPTDLDKLQQMETMENINAFLNKLPTSLKNQMDITQYVLGFDPEQDTAKTRSFVEKYSPVHYLNKDVPPTLIFHGDADQLVPVEQSFALKQSLDALQVNCELHIFEDVNHGFFGISKKQKEDTQLWVVDFIKRNYHSTIN